MMKLRMINEQNILTNLDFAVENPVNNVVLNSKDEAAGNGGSVPP